jgi:hypothetical protein
LQSSNKRSGCFGAQLGSAKGRFDEGVIVRCPWRGEQLRHAVVCAELLDRLGSHLATAVVEDLLPLVFEEVEDVLVVQTYPCGEPHGSDAGVRV